MANGYSRSPKLLKGALTLNGTRIDMTNIKVPVFHAVAQHDHIVPYDASKPLIASVGASGGFDAEGHPEVYRRALRLIESGRIDVASIITHRYTRLEQVPQALAGDWRAADYVKGVVTL